MTGKERLDVALVRIAKCAARCGHTLPAFEVDRMGGGYRLVCNNGSRDISPRLPLRDFLQWLDGFEVALTEVEHAINHAEVQYGAGPESGRKQWTP